MAERPARLRGAQNGKRLMWAAGLGLVTLAVALVGCGSASQAQKSSQLHPVGLMHVGLDHIPPSLASLRSRLAQLGWTQGVNVDLRWRNLADEAAADAQAKEFVREKVDLIVAWENQSVRAAKAATAGTDIPVVFLHVTDPVEGGLVKSLAHPGGNLTGIYGRRGLIGKQIELYTEVMPSLRRLLVLIDPTDPTTTKAVKEIRAAAAQQHLELVPRLASDRAELDRVFSSLRPGEVDAVYMLSPNIQTKFSSYVIGLSLDHNLPVSSHRKEWVERGALFSYGPDYRLIGRAAARYVDQLLRGAKPQDLPVQEVARLELAVNLAVASKLHIQVPQSLLVRAKLVVR